MKRLAVIFLLWVPAILWGTPTPLVLISLDGFRWDYMALHPAETPHLLELARSGVTARNLIPIFPSNTFADHYSIVTGLYPSHHGIINNHMFDAARGEFFHYNQPTSARRGDWWGGEPIWATAIRQGYKSAAAFWPGSEAEIGGIRPTYWRPYDYSIPFEARLDEMIGWLKKPEAERPVIVTFYLEETNSVGHRVGPDSPLLTATIKMLDDRIGAMTRRLQTEGIEANLVVVSDHGMTGADPERVLLLDDYIDLATVQIDFDESVAGLRPRAGTETAKLIRALRRMPHAKVYGAADLPRRFRVNPASSRVPPIWVLPDEGWNIMRRSAFEVFRNHFSKGQHGYDPSLSSMRGILIAHGPAFKSGVVINAVENVHVYNLLCAALGLKPAPNDGDNRLVRAALR